jgi:putative transferase (TIGR04331 family)
MKKNELVLYKKYVNIKNANLFLFGNWLLEGKKKKGLKILTLNSANLTFSERKNDICYKIANKLSNSLSISLNKLFNLNKNHAYWNTILYPWIFSYTTYIICLIRRVEAILKIKKKFICKIENHSFFKKKIPNELVDFASFLSSEDWNASQVKVICDFLQKNKKKKIIFKLIKNTYKKSFLKHEPRSYNTFKDKILYIFFYVMNFLPSRNEQPLIIGSGLPWLQDILLKISYFSFPKIYESPKIIYKKNDLKIRKKLVNILIKNKKLSKLERIVFSNVKYLMPKAYLENYNLIVTKTKKINWPFRPKFIFTSFNHGWDEFFKIWCAEKRSMGIPFFIGQHGSSYNILNSSKYYIEEKVPDNFITWGWKNRNNFHIPAFVLKT